MSIFITTIIFLLPKFLFKMKINLYLKEFFLTIPLVMVLTMKSVDNSSYELLLFPLYIILYLILYILFSKKVSNSLKYHLKLYNIEEFKYIKIPNIKVFYILKLIITLLLVYFIIFKNIMMVVLLSAVILLFIYSFLVKKRQKQKILQQNYNNGIVDILDKYNPALIFYFSAPNANFLYHISMWLPYIKNLNIPFFIMIREGKYLKSLLSQINDVPIVVAKSLNDIEYFLPKSVKIALYANNGTKNTHMVRFNHITHIQLLHGDSEKAPSFNPVSKMYDKLFVSGQRAIDRYYENNINIDLNCFEIIGRPQVSEILKNTTNHLKTILIAPTWQGFHKDTDLSTLYELLPIIEYILKMNKNLKIIFRHHPLTNPNTKINQEYFAKIKNLLDNDIVEHIFCSQEHIIEDFNQSDCIITDISSVPIDYLYSEKPIIHYDINNLSKEFQENIIYKKYSKAVYVINKEYENLNLIFDDIYTKDSLKDTRKDIKVYYHSEFDKSLNDVFKNAILKELL